MRYEGVVCRKTCDDTFIDYSMKTTYKSFNLIIIVLTIAAVALLSSASIKSTFFGGDSKVLSFSDAMHDRVPPAVEQKKSTIYGKPSRLVIKSVSIDIAVTDGIYNEQDRTWSLSNDKAHYALISPLANDAKGNTFIYGHNRREVFSRLEDVVANDTLKLITDNGYEFTYSFVDSVTTDPYDDSLFRYSGSPIVTLQTCSGLWFQNRSLFTFKLDSVQKVTANAV